MSKVVDMTVGKPTKHIINFALPLLLTNLGQQLYMMIDGAIVGRGVSVKALASVGTTDWCYWLVLWAIIGLTQGFSTFISRYYGDKNYKKLNETIAVSIILCLIVGAILTILGILLSRPVLSLLNTPEDVFEGANTYLITMISGTLIVTAYNMSSAILRALGDGKTPLIAMAIAGVLNLALDCLFVFCFKWGIFGAGFASVISQAVSFVYCFIAIGKIDFISLPKDAWKMDKTTVKEMLFLGLPISFQYAVISFGGIILQSSVNLQGSIFIAGYTATNKVYGLLECSATSLGIATSTFVAQNYGAKLYDRVKTGVKVSVILVCITAVITFVIMFLARRLLCSLFINANEVGGNEALTVAVNYLTTMLCSILILYLLHVFRNTLQAMQISFWPMISGIAEFLCRVFMAKVAINWAFLGANALFVSEPVAWLGALLSVMLPYFFYRKRLKE